MNIVHATNHSAFSVLNEESLYWLGFIAADGCVTKRYIRGVTSSHVVEVALSPRDTNHLVKLKSFLETTAPINIRPRRCRILVNSRRIVLALIEHGITPAKSKTIVVSDVLAGSRHFWRGAVDGDGYLSLKMQRGRPSPQATFEFVSSSAAFMDQFQSFLPERLRVPTLFRNSVSRDTLAFKASSRKAFLIIDLLYAGASVFLDRKMETYKIIKDAYRSIIPKKKIHNDNLSFGFIDCTQSACCRLLPGMAEAAAWETDGAGSRQWQPAEPTEPRFSISDPIGAYKERIPRRAF